MIAVEALSEAARARQRARDHYAANREAKKAYQRAYYQANKERISERTRQYQARPENRERKREWDRLWRQRNPDKAGDHQRKWRYGLSRDDYDQLLASQGGGCAVCGVRSNPNGKMLAVDHDHATGQVRGITCNDCNVGLGRFKDEIEILEAAIRYLRRER